MNKQILENGKEKLLPITTSDSIIYKRDTSIENIIIGSPKINTHNSNGDVVNEGYIKRLRDIESKVMNFRDGSINIMDRVKRIKLKETVINKELARIQNRLDVLKNPIIFNLKYSIENDNLILSWMVHGLFEPVSKTFDLYINFDEPIVLEPNLVNGIYNATIPNFDILANFSKIKLKMSYILDDIEKSVETKFLITANI